MEAEISSRHLHTQALVGNARHIVTPVYRIPGPQLQASRQKSHTSLPSRLPWGHSRGGRHSFRISICLHQSTVSISSKIIINFEWVILHYNPMSEESFKVHSKLHNVTLVTTRVLVIFRSSVVLTWMSDKIELVKHVTLWHNTVNVIIVTINIMMTMWCEQVLVWILWWFILMSKNPLYMRGKRDNKEWDWNFEHPFSRVSGYKRRSNIKEVDVMELDVYIYSTWRPSSLC